MVQGPRSKGCIRATFGEKQVKLCVQSQLFRLYRSPSLGPRAMVSKQPEKDVGVRSEFSRYRLSTNSRPHLETLS